MNKYKIIHNPSIARQLLHKGHEIVDIKPSKFDKRMTVFVFECTCAFLRDLSIISDSVK